MNKKFVIRSVISNDDVDDRSLEGVQYTLMTAAGICCCADIMYYVVTRACPLCEASFWDMGRVMGSEMGREMGLAMGKAMDKTIAG